MEIGWWWWFKNVRPCRRSSYSYSLTTLQALLILILILILVLIFLLRRYSYSPDSAVEDSARPSMSSTLPLPRSWSSSLPSCQLSVWWFSCYDSYQLSDGFHVTTVISLTDNTRWFSFFRSRSRSSPYENDSGDQVHLHQHDCHNLAPYYGAPYFTPQLS